MLIIQLLWLPRCACTRSHYKHVEKKESKKIVRIWIRTWITKSAHQSRTAIKLPTPCYLHAVTLPSLRDLEISAYRLVVIYEVFIFFLLGM